MKRQDKKTQNDFIERCKTIALLSKYFETQDCELDDAAAVRSYDDRPDWVQKCVEIAKNPERIDIVEYSPMCGVDIDGTDIPTAVLFNSTHEMLTEMVHEYLNYWRSKLLDHVIEMSEAITYIIKENEPNDDVCTEHYEVMYYNDRLGWLADKYSMILNQDIDFNEFLDLRWKHEVFYVSI